MQSSSQKRITAGRRRERRAWRWLALLLVLAVGPACDTVAEITFTKERLDLVRGLGYRPDSCTASGDPLEVCKPPGCGKLDFVMETNENRFLQPNQQIVDLDGRLTPGENFGNSPDDVDFQRTWLFQLGPNGQDQTCTEPTDCATGFQCRALTETDLPADSANAGVQLCVRPATIQPEANSLTYTAFDDDPQPENNKTSGLGHSGLSLVLNLDNSGSLIGKEDGVGPIDQTRATDPDAERLSAIKSFLAELILPARSELRGNIQYGLFLMAGSGNNGVTNVFKADAAIQNTFISDSNPEDATSRVGDEVDRLQQLADGLTPVWEAYVLAGNAFADPEDNARSNYARRVLTFVDSGSDGSSMSLNTDTAIAAMQVPEVDGQTTIIHLDSLIPAMPELSGPLAGYNRLACETGGYYVYEQYPRALEDQLRRLGLGYEGRWSLNVEIQAGEPVAAMSELDPGWYRVATSMTVRLAGASETYRFRLQGLSSLLVQDQTLDTRLLLHVQDPANN